MTDYLIAAGTPCYLSGLVEQSAFNGRVVESIRPAQMDAHRGPWYECRAAWITEMFGLIECLVSRKNLVPIIPPKLAIPAQRETAKQ